MLVKKDLQEYLDSNPCVYSKSVLNDDFLLSAQKLCDSISTNTTAANVSTGLEGTMPAHIF